MMASATLAFVTGGNHGLGYEIVKALLQSDNQYHVFLASRSLEKARQAIELLHNECPGVKNTVEAVEVDLTSDKAIENALKHVQAGRGYIDVLINNAGAAFDSDCNAGKISLRECFTAAYDVNVAGTHVLTSTFMPLLLKSSDPRLIFVTGLSHMTLASQSYFPTPPQPAGWPKHIQFETIGYRCSKVALNMLVLDWNHKLKVDKVKVWGVAPGFMVTGLGGDEEKLKAMGAEHPGDSAQFLKSVVEGERDADVGKLIDKNGIMLP